MALSIRNAGVPSIQWLALGAAVVGAVLWWRLLSVPAPTSTLVDTAPATHANPVAHWFDNLPVQVEIKVFGLLAGNHGAMAVLGINDAPARPFMVGEQLAQGVTLVGVEPAAVVIERNGSQSSLPINKVLDAVALPSLLRH